MPPAVPDMDALMSDPAALQQMQTMMQNPMMQQMLQDPQMIQTILAQVRAHHAVGEICVATARDERLGRGEEAFCQQMILWPLDANPLLLPVP